MLYHLCDQLGRQMTGTGYCLMKFEVRRGRGLVWRIWEVMGCMNSFRLLSAVSFVGAEMCFGFTV